ISAPGYLRPNAPRSPIQTFCPLYLGTLEAIGNGLDAFCQRLDAVGKSVRTVAVSAAAFGVGQFVGDRQQRHDQETRFAGLPRLRPELADAGIDRARQIADARFFAGTAADRIFAPV